MLALQSVTTRAEPCRPWEAPRGILIDAGVELGVNYPEPIIDEDESREALAHVSAIIAQSVCGGNVKARMDYIYAWLLPEFCKMEYIAGCWGKQEVPKKRHVLHPVSKFNCCACALCAEALWKATVFKCGYPSSIIWFLCRCHFVQPQCHRGHWDSARCVRMALLKRLASH